MEESKGKHKSYNSQQEGSSAGIACGRNTQASSLVLKLVTKGVFTCKISYRYELYWYEIFHRYHVNNYRAISKNQDELEPVRVVLV